jgi:hypothetical protein
MNSMQSTFAHSVPTYKEQQHIDSGAVMGGVRLLLRAEGASVLAAALFAYSRIGSDWSTFAWYFLVPDLAFFAYLGGSRIGALAYNATHSYVGAALALSIGVSQSLPLLTSASLIWFAHIGMDRALGYGLKYFAGFGFTHLGRVGKVRA